jgi:hypothetical protein
MSRSTAKAMLAGFAIALSFCAPRASACVQVEPGDFVTPQDASRITPSIIAGCQTACQLFAFRIGTLVPGAGVEPAWSFSPQGILGYLSLTLTTRNHLVFIFLFVKMCKFMCKF